jgi:hypothetical protein
MLKMDFSEALWELKAGKEIRRSSWASRDWARLTHHPIQARSWIRFGGFPKHNDYRRFNEEDNLADDWLLQD